LGEKNKTLWGRDYYFDQLGSFKFKISFPSFYQVNHSQVMALYNKILEFADLKRKDVVVDAYAGVGTICAWVANLAGEVYGIEEVASACSDAEANMKMNRIGNVKYGEGRVEEILPELLKMGIKPSVIIVDPPRAGCTSEAIKALPAARPAKIIYVSCAPATLGRDLKKLTAAGYALKVVQPIDMFPHTAHIESVSLLEKTARAC
jgi:23S rRNA (uracil1939-C5)-methyltransferase